VSDRPCPHCGTLIERIDGEVDPRGGGHVFWLTPCGHRIEATLAYRAYKDGDPPVYIEGVTGVSLVAAERSRQQTEEGYPSEEDAAQEDPNLGWVAWAYVDAGINGWDAHEPPAAWPRSPEEWKPGPTDIRCLVIGAATVCAEIDRRIALGEPL
jgi:hypothetical protein